MDKYQRNIIVTSNHEMGVVLSHNNWILRPHMDKHYSMMTTVESEPDELVNLLLFFSF